jgi:hypothetical protein
MTRAVVANLNRRRAETSNLPKQDSNMTTPISSPARRGSPQGPLPQPSSANKSKELPEIPEFYIVRPAPSNAKVERNDSRVFINRNTMERIGVTQGSVLLIQRHDPLKSTRTETAGGNSNEEGARDEDEEDEEAEQPPVGVAWPMDRIEPSGDHSTLPANSSGANGIIFTTVRHATTRRPRRSISLSLSNRRGEGSSPPTREDRRSSRPKRSPSLLSPR